MNKIYISNNSYLAQAQSIASFTGQIIVSTNIPDEDIYLSLSSDGLAIVCKQFKPLYIRDIYNKVYLRKDSLSRELLIQAVKTKPADDILIIDATAGLAKDAALLGLYGYRVIMLEENPLLATVIYYALQERLLPADNLEVVFTNSLDYFKINPDIKPYAIYLDPMFKTDEKALAKKDMQIIQLVTKDARNADIELFHAAYCLAHRLIVKRDNKQKALVDLPHPTYSKQGKTIRYDVYIR